MSLDQRAKIMGCRVWRSWSLGQLGFEVADRRKGSYERLRRAGSKRSPVNAGHVKARKGIEDVFASLVACDGVEFNVTSISACCHASDTRDATVKTAST